MAFRKGVLSAVPVSDWGGGRYDILPGLEMIGFALPVYGGG